MSVSLAAGGPGLGAMWGREKAVEMLGDAGFTSVRVAELPHDPINYYYVAVKPLNVRFRGSSGSRGSRLTPEPPEPPEPVEPLNL